MSQTGENTDGTGASLSERTAKLKQRFLGSPYSVDIERARYFTRAWKKAEDAGPCMKAAVGLKEALENMSIRIDEGESLAGIRSVKRRGGVIAVEKGTFNGAVESMINPQIGKRINVVGGATSARGKQFVESISDDEIREWKEILPYWRGKTASSLKREKIEKEGVFKGPPGLGPAALYNIFRGLGGIKGISEIAAKNKTPGGPKKSEDGKETVKRKITGSIAGLRGSLDTLSKVRQALQDNLPDLMYISLNVQGHTIPGYKRVLKIGFKGIAEWAQKALSDLAENDEDSEGRKDFYQSVSVAAESVCDYSNRYAALAEQMAAQSDESGRSELLEIADRCRRVPAEPPRTFMEALQSIWMTWVVLEISYGIDNIFSPGRVDQYLYPFYKADIEAGRITREQALEAVEEFLIKVADEYIEGGNVLTIGGVGRNGEDATNDVSFLFLEAFENTRGLGNSMPTRISPKTPRDFLLKACKVHRKTGGIAFYNDEIVTRDLQADGFSLEDARDYGVIGCVEPTSVGNCFSYTAGNGIFLLGALEMALNRGRRVLGDNQLIGVETPDPATFKTFDDVKDAFEKQIAYIVGKSVQASELKDKAYAEAFPCLLLSATVEGCLENGKDVTRGGARYNHGHMNAQALASTANSLAAIKWAVFDEKIVSMKELVKHLHNNFRNAENLRQKLLNKAPKYGNDNPEADEIAAWVAEVLSSQTRKHKSWRGGIYRPSLFSSGTQHIEGAFLGATPDGRKAGDVVSNGISPTNGTERNGPTAVFNSAAKAGNALLSDGTALNLNVSPFMLKSDESVEKFASLIEGYFKMGGRQVQFNPYDPRMLKDAQAHPEKYPDLTVKVTGYSAIFVDIAKPLQDDIIARTEFCNL